MVHTPETAEDLADALRRFANNERTISLYGNGSKGRMAGSVEPADEQISTCALRRVLEYEPQDLTISVEAGLRWCELEQLLASNRQMVPLDPPFSAAASVGGVLAANSSGPRRRLYGTARDLVIGMRFVTLAGKVAQTGGMVVKNVAGLDMAKLMIGSFGTLGAIAVANFKVQPMPEVERSFMLSFDSAPAVIGARNRLLQSWLQPSAIDLCNPRAGATLGNRAWMMLVRVGGNQAAVQRYERELAELGDGVALDNDHQQTLWRHVGEFTPNFLVSHLDGVVIRVSCTLKELEDVCASVDGPVLARAGSGVCYGYFEQAAAAAEWMRGAVARGWKAVVEFSPADRSHAPELWPCAGKDLELMRRIKQLFDPSNLLNRGRLYNRI